MGYVDKSFLLKDYDSSYTKPKSGDLAVFFSWGSFHHLAFFRKNEFKAWYTLGDYYIGGGVRQEFFLTIIRIISCSHKLKIEDYYLDTDAQNELKNQIKPNRPDIIIAYILKEYNPK